MFFPRLRRHAKWMFVVLAIGMAGGFVIFGVGAGGVGVGDLFKNNSSGDSASVSDAKKAIEQDPTDADAWRELSTALQTEGKTVDAVDALQHVIKLTPKDADAYRELGGLQLAHGQELARKAQLLELQAVYGGADSSFVPTITVGGQTVGDNKIVSALQQTAGARISEVSSQSQTAFSDAVATYRQLVKLQPDDPNLQLELATTAEQAGDAAAAIEAYERFLKLAPEDSNAAIVKQQLKQLRASTGVASG